MYDQQGCLGLGCRFFWELRVLLGFAKWPTESDMLVSRRILNSWAAWSKLASDAGLGSQMLAPASSSKGSPELPLDGTPGKFHLVDTQALVMLLITRWHKARIQEHRQFAKQILESPGQNFMEGEDLEVSEKLPGST